MGMSLWIQACLVDTEASTSEPTNSCRASVPSSPLCLPSHWERVPVCWEGLLSDYNPMLYDYNPMSSDYNPILYTRMQCFLSPPASRGPLHWVPTPWKMQDRFAKRYSGITNHSIYLLILRFQWQYNCDRAGF